MDPSRTFLIASWTMRAVVAIILLQTLFFKFTGAKESVYIFTTVGHWMGIGAMEPWGRLGTGALELIASVLLLLPRTTAWGALLSLSVIGGALFFHLAVLGISMPAVNDRGELFALALTVFVLSAILLIMHRSELPRLTQMPANSVSPL
jgi:hypothetical protein